MWYVYLAESLKTGEFYCGVSTDVSRRMMEHNNSSSKGAKWTRSRRPLILRWTSHPFERQGEALREECKIKKLSHKQKVKMSEEKV